MYSPDRDGLFAAIVATLDRKGYGIHRARVLDAPHDAIFDVFEVLPRDTYADGDPQRLAATLRQVLAGDLQQVRPARRAVPGQLRHFRFAPRVEFSESADGRRTRISLVAPDRPGLLADVAHVLRVQHLRVHDARIATFGERAEDQFQITDEHDRPLSESARQALRDALCACLDPCLALRRPPMATSKKTAPKQSATTNKATSKPTRATRGKAAKAPVAASKPLAGVGKKSAAAGAIGSKAAAPSAAGHTPAAKKAASKQASSTAPRVAKQPTKVVSAPAAEKAAAAKKLPIAEQAVHSAATQVGSDELKFGIESAFERRATLTMDEIDGSTRAMVTRVIDGLESGEFRVAEPDGQGGWAVNAWLKKKPCCCISASTRWR